MDQSTLGPRSRLLNLKVKSQVKKVSVDKEKKPEKKSNSRKPTSKRLYILKDINNKKEGEIPYEVENIEVVVKPKSKTQNVPVKEEKPTIEIITYTIADFTQGQ
jgi:hypothetical protein